MFTFFSLLHSLDKTSCEQSLAYDAEEVSKLLIAIYATVRSRRIVSSDVIDKLCSLLAQSDARVPGKKLKSYLDKFAYDNAIEAVLTISNILHIDLEADNE